MRLSLLYVHSPEIGYGRMGTKLSDALRRAGVDIYDDMPTGGGIDNSPFKPPTARTAACAHVSWFSTPGHCRGWWKGQTRSILTMWESRHLPEPFRESLDEFDTLMCPSLQNVELFSEYHDNVRFVPLGIDPTEWYPLERPKMDTTHFTYLICGGGKRKGVDLVVEAFKKVWGNHGSWPEDGPVPRLIVKSPRSSALYGHERIEVLSGFIGDLEERALYSLAHVYVQPSRGEGFGLQPLQAIAQGCPTIATDAHGHLAYRDLITYPLGWTIQDTPPESFHHGPAGTWWEPDPDELCESMEDAYYNYESLLDTCVQNGLRAGLELNWDRSAQAYLDAVGRERLELPDIFPADWHDFEGEQEWIAPRQRRYGISVIKPQLFDVAGTQLYMVPSYGKCKLGHEVTAGPLPLGEESMSVPCSYTGCPDVVMVTRKVYYEVADIKRILFDSHMLDPSCLQGIDHGLLPEQAERIPNYTAAHANCPTCHQKLNTNPVPLEEALALPIPTEW